MKKSKKMKVFSITILFLITVFTFTSCLKEVDYNSELTEKKLVVNALCEVGEPFTVQLERTITFENLNDTNNKITSGATITVTNVNTGQVYTQSIPSTDNFYEFPFLTAPNTTYKIEVSHPDYETVSSTMTTNSVVPLISVDTISSMNDGQPILEGTFTFQDPPGENFYLIRVLTNSLDSTFYYSNTNFVCNDLSVGTSLNQDLFGENYGQAYYVFTDELFNGQEKKMKVESYNPFMWQSVGSSTQVIYELVTLNEDSYKYYKSLIIQAYTDPTFSEPAKLYTNILNGYGIFAPLQTERIIFE